MTSAYNFPSKSFNDELISHDTGLAAKSLLNKYQHQMDESFRDGIDVNQLISARSGMIDLLFNHIWQREEFDKIKACLVAVGGYGRGELHPKSDIDFLIILAEKPNTEVEKKISRLVTFLWDSDLMLVIVFGLLMTANLLQKMTLQFSQICLNQDLLQEINLSMNL